MVRQPTIMIVNRPRRNTITNIITIITQTALTYIHTYMHTVYKHTYTLHTLIITGHCYLLRGLNCALRTGEGKRNLYSHSPDSTSHKQTFQSVDELNNFLLLLLQLKQNIK